MQKIIYLLSLIFLMLSLGFVSCKKDYKDKESNAYKILGVWKPTKFITRYVDFSGNNQAFERTTFDNDEWEFSKKKKLLIYTHNNATPSYQYKYDISETNLFIGSEIYTVLQLDNTQLQYIKAAKKNDTIIIDGEAKGIASDLEWHFKK